MIEKFQELVESLKREYPATSPGLIVFPSGAASLSVHVGQETYLFEYYPSFKAFGISRRSTATYGWEGVENTFNTFEQAEAWWRELLSGNAGTGET